METNKYMPASLPIVSDANLLRTLREYENVYDRLDASSAAAARDEQAQIEQAARAIQAELSARGIGAEPWWATRQPAPRPARPYRGGTLAGGLSRRVRS